LTPLPLSVIYQIIRIDYAKLRCEMRPAEHTMKCPRCDHPRQPGSRECPKCGIDYAYVERKIGLGDQSAMQTPPETAPPDAQDQPPPSPADTPNPNQRSCPKCGFLNQGQAPECLRCGIIFDKYEAYLEKKRKVEEETNQTTDGLLDPETIQMVAEAADQSQAAMDYAKTACPHCSQRYKIRQDQVGITTRCKKCSSIFRIESLPVEH
jgi:predicted Zn finger-like uncharacterized protein